MNRNTKSGAVATRRRFLTAAGAAALAGFPAVVRAESAVHLRWQGAWSARDIFHEYALDYARRVIEMSGGRVRIDLLPAGAVVKPQDLLDAVHKGVLDGAHATPGLWHAKSAAFSLFGAGPALGMDANHLLSWVEYGGGRTLYQELHRQLLNLDVAAFLYGPMPTQPLGWFRKPIASPAQFKGLRFHATGPAAQLYGEMGAKAEALDEDRIVAAFGAGQLDGAATNNASTDLRLGLPAVARHCMLQSYHRPAQVFEVLVNRKRLEALPADLRAILRHAAQAASADMSWKAIDRYSADYAELREKHQVAFQSTPETVLRAQLRAWSALAERESRENPFFEKVLNSQLAWARRTVRWSLDTTVDPRIAYDHWFARPARGASRKP